MTVTVLSKTDNHIIYGEDSSFGVILHGYVRKPWTKGKLKTVKEAIAKLSKASARPLLAFNRNPTPQWEKFVRQIGGIPDQTRVTGDGDPVMMYRFPPLD